VKQTASARVLVSHPGRQHSHQAALALHRAGRLAGYWAGVPSRDAHARWLPGSVRRRYASIEVPDSLARWMPVAVILRRLGRAAPRAAEQAIDYVACRAFDRQVAHGLDRTRASAVMACEISALDTFRAARLRGMTTILDAASVHYAVQDRVCPPAESESLHRRFVTVKRAELELADHVLTVSEMARAGYVDAGVPAGRVHAVPLGVDTRLFTPGAARGGPATAPFTFVFAGATIFRKGIDVLLAAFRAATQGAPGKARLLVVGPRGDAHALLERGQHADVVSLPPVAQVQLAEIFRSADCFVLPSRHDSFGMAVLEAMACGLPAIVSQMVGAREAIDEGASGWVVAPADAAALAARMAWCIEHRAAVAAMRPRARAGAERYTWERYGARLNSVLARIVGAES
jgi:glycosyltransferase involved in cell wall biosynthesis